MNTEANTAAGSNSKRWAALVTLLAGAFLDILDGQIILVALPTIQAHLGLGPSAVLWTTSAYFLAAALTLITGGRLGDLVGRKRIFVIGIVGFGLSSLAAGLAGDAVVLLAARAVQGVMAGLMAPQVSTFIQVEFPPAERGKAFGLVGMTYALGGLLGPATGGLLSQLPLAESWRSVFLVNVPIAAVLTVLTVRWMRESRADVKPHLDGAGVAVLTAGLCALLLPLIQGPAMGWGPVVVVLLAASPVVLWLFIRRETRLERQGGSPLVPPSLLRHRTVGTGLILQLLLFAAMGAPFLLSLHLQNTLHVGPLMTALYQLPTVLGVVAGSIAAGALVAGHGRRVVAAGIALLVAGLAWLAFAIVTFGQNLGFWSLLPGFILLGLGCSAIPVSLASLVLGAIDPKHAGSGSGLLQTFGGVGGALCMALAGLGYFGGHATGEAAAWVLLAEAGLALVTLPLVFRLPRVQ